ncbi:MAG: DUF5989 family protein [Candidatus Eisenbacteria bacterium]|nr:DUF5989 family protein [Candidatus Eisenbacteria bacterium]
MERISMLRDLWDFLRERKKFWLLPVILMLLVLGVFVILSGSSAIAPFIYALF